MSSNGRFTMHSLLPSTSNPEQSPTKDSRYRVQKERWVLNFAKTGMSPRSLGPRCRASTIEARSFDFEQ
jgi:hypothetical protein